MEEFLSGNLRLGYYRYYFHKPSEDHSWDQIVNDPSLLKKNSRSSKYEGNIRNLKVRDIDGVLRSECVRSFSTPHYYLSFSKQYKQNYGIYTVKLNNPLEFHKRIVEFIGLNLGHYLGSMVYCDELEVFSNQFDSRLICLYSDSRNNASKDEFRFAYYLLL